MEINRPFDLGRGPLIRALLLRLSGEEHAAALTMHHIVSDGWSMSLLIREVAALYQASPLPELPIQYADFAYWQHLWLQGEVLESQLAYWRAQLGSSPPALELPADPGLTMITYTAQPASASQDALDFLASWAASLDQPAQAETAQAPDEV